MALSGAQPMLDGANENDILKIISNLPSGWKVVGLTDLNQDKGSSIVPNVLPQNLEAKGNEHHKNTKQDAIPLKVSNNYDSHSQMTCGKQQISSAVEDIPVPAHINSSAIPLAKAECREERMVSSSVGNHSNYLRNSSATLGTSHEVIKLENEENTSASHLPLSSKFSKQALSGSTKDVLMPFGDDSKWTVVGIAPLSHLQSPDSSAPNFRTFSPMSPNTTPLLSSGENSTTHQSQTILKIPHCGLQTANLSSPPTPNVTTASLSPGKNNCEPNSGEMMWTVVGITTSLTSTATPYLMAPQSSLVGNATETASLVNATKIVSSQSENNQFVNSSLLLSQHHHHVAIGAQPSFLPKTTGNANQSSALCSAFPGLSSLVSNDTPNQAPSEWRVVGISPLVNTQDSLPNYSHFQSNQVIPISSLAPEKGLTTPSTAATTTLAAQPQIFTPSSSTDIEVTNLYSQVKLPVSTSPSTWQDSNNITSNPNDQPSSTFINGPASKGRSDTNNSLAIINKDLQILGSTLPPAQQEGPRKISFGCTSPSAQQDGQRGLGFVSLQEAQSNQWKVVGVVANNQVSMISPEKGHEDGITVKDAKPVAPITMASSEPSVLLQVPENKEPRRITKVQSCVDRNFPYVSMECRSEKKEHLSALVLAPGEHEACLDKKKQFDWNCRAKDMLKRPNTSKLKKNTVSNLLKMKRCHNSAHDPSEVNSAGEIYEADLIRFSDDIPKKRCRTRSLRSFSSSRQQLHNSMDSHDSAFHLRSCSDTTISDHNSEEETERIQVRKTEKFSPAPLKMNSPERHGNDVSSHSFCQSPARRRKLKVPRKMVADLDYHPFDSSSDSN